MTSSADIASPAAWPGVRVAWVDGLFMPVMPAESLALPVGDAGFVLGATVTEQLRTFHGDLFLPDAHEERLRESLSIVGITPGLPLGAIFTAAAAVARHNHAVGPADDDLGLVVFVTPGDLPSQHGGTGGSPRIVVHTFPLAFRLWADAYESGVPLRSVSVRQVPEACWPVQAKVRSRLHYFLADREAHAVEPGAKAVICHLDGRVSETSTANILIVRGGTIIAPPAADALSGVSLRCAQRLAGSLGIEWQTSSLSEADLASADEIMLTSTPNCILPALRFNGCCIGHGRPGATYRRLLSAWSEWVGLDIASQSRSRAASGNGGG